MRKWLMKSIVSAVLLTCGPSPQALDRWGSDDTKIQLAFVSMGAIDIVMTDLALRRGDLVEQNPVLGPKPSRAKLWLLGGGAVISHTLIACLLHGDARRLWQSFGLGIEFTALAGNTVLLIGGGF